MAFGPTVKVASGVTVYPVSALMEKLPSTNPISTAVALGSAGSKSLLGPKLIVADCPFNLIWLSSLKDANVVLVPLKS